ncbi:MAG: BTAD domain-containing putative transcriptional regulator, partial [Nitriliruptorales bacterium]|nr:BTAD domain-containing putative transcriptional regulator [Nitriliruptorales bacterium]
MTLDVWLLGSPAAERDGHPVSLRGTKGWVLLTCLVTADRPVTRQRLARLLFPEAKDPAGALRWNLSQLRRELGVELDGDPVAVHLPEGTRIDVLALKSGAATEAVELQRFGDELLAGVDDPANETLMAWLDGERRHVRGMTVDVLREAALVHRSQGDLEQAVHFAEACAAMDPLDENTATLLVRCLREVGRATDAIEVAETARRRLETELGVTPSSALWSAAHAPINNRPAAASGRLAVEALLDTGEAAISAGATDAGIDTLREALGASRMLDEPDVVARSLTALGSALIHAVRGTDQDGVALLHDALPLAERAGLRSLAARASRELGYVDMLRARYERANWWFERSRQLADGDDEERAWLGAFAGAARTDVADF